MWDLWQGIYLESRQAARCQSAHAMDHRGAYAPSQPLTRVIRWHDAYGWRCAFSPCLHCAVTTSEEDWHQTEIVEHHIFPSHSLVSYAGMTHMAGAVPSLLACIVQ